MRIAPRWAGLAARCGFAFPASSRCFRFGPVHAVHCRGTVQRVSDTRDATGSHQALGKIALGQKEVSEQELGRHEDAAISRRDSKEVRRLNKLVPYLDLFTRLEDREIARLADVPERTVARMRTQVSSVGRKLEPFVKLLDRLNDQQLGRVAQISPKMFLYLRLCQPRGPNISLQMPVRVPKFVSISNENTELVARDSEESPGDTSAHQPVTARNDEVASDAPVADPPYVPDSMEFEFAFIDDEDDEDDDDE